MLTVEEALQLVLRHATPRSAVRVPLSPACLGLVLAEDVASDLDMPPYTKSLVDGYAVRAADLAGGAGRLLVVDEIPAGRSPTLPLEAGQTARIMTGAELPAGADAVVMLERSEPLPDQRVYLRDERFKPGQNVLPRGREMRAGEVVLRAGTVLRPQELGLLATVGVKAPLVHQRPAAAILSTGDEVVEPGEQPNRGQIRNSNGTLLAAQAARAGAVTRYLGIARDRLDSLGPLVAEGLKNDVLVLSGGVSAGKLDLVPEVLKEQGVTPVFHKVAMKPGKPLFFGVKEDRLIFGLPGNPVSALVGFELFVRPAMARLLGHAATGPRIVAARMGVEFFYQTDRVTYHPAHLDFGEDGWVVTPIPWFGSPDLRAVSQANAFAVFHPDHPHYRAGERVSVLAPE
jgi:molybdopterin molybdotransferase